MKEFEQLINPLWKYIHYSPSRYPLGDWFETTDAKYINFRARSVVGWDIYENSGRLSEAQTITRWVRQVRPGVPDYIQDRYFNNNFVSL